jgi:hypothetical protein
MVYRLGDDKVSVDLSIKAKRVVEIYETNITYNLADMYYKAIDEKLGLKKLKRMTCDKALPIINKAIEDMVKNKAEYIKLNPKNGWGTYDGLLEQFREMRNVCEENPDGFFDMDIGD